MAIDKIRIKNYKCFNDEGCVIENIKPINIIIGKNNTGKSSLVETVKFLTDYNKTYLENKRNGKNAEIIFEHIIIEELINNAFPGDIWDGAIGTSLVKYGKTFVNSTLLYKINENQDKTFIRVNKEYFPSITQYFERYVWGIKSPLKQKIFRHLSAERDIQPETLNFEIELSSTGVGATNLIQSIINLETYESELAEKKLLTELNKILNPDIEFSRILVQHNQSQIWEIYFENDVDGRVALSKMGSGVKTILLVLILLHIKPSLDNRKIEDYVFAFEELENNLHPSLQRRLYYYLFEFSKQTKCTLFLTTHSNIVIDLYNSLEDAQILHIQKVDGVTKITSIDKHFEFKRIIDDLEIKASDILQSNGIIWVEGPSDRTYLKRWINLVDKSLIEGYHYSIMYYGGRLLSNLTFDFELVANELIPLLKLNTNSFVIMDRDGKTASKKLNETKLRIQKEIGSDNVWITKGREIENYLSNKNLETWLLSKHNIKCSFANDLNTKLEDSILKVDTFNKIKYKLNKNKYALEIASFIDSEQIRILDLSEKIYSIVEIIKKWNKK